MSHATLEVVHMILEPLLVVTKWVLSIKNVPLVMLNIIEKTDNFIPIIVLVLSLLVKLCLEKENLSFNRIEKGGRSTCLGEPPTGCSSFPSSTCCMVTIPMIPLSATSPQPTSFTLHEVATHTTTQHRITPPGNDTTACTLVAHTTHIEGSQSSFPPPPTRSAG